MRPSESVMGRPKSVHHDLPPRMSARAGKRHTRYFYCAGQRRIPLGTDKAQALLQWAQYEAGKLTVGDDTFAAVAKRYREEVLPTKAPKTQRDQAPQLESLVAVFGRMTIGDIQPKDVRAYLDKRSAKTQANREIALLSHVFNRAREWGNTSAANPCRGVTKHKERAREVYVTAAMFRAVYEAADDVLRDAMDIAELIGQRVADVLKARRQDIADGYLHVRQRKTGTPLRIEMTPALQAVVDRALNRPRTAASFYVLATERGRPLSYWMLRDRFDAAREKVRKTDPALADWQFRDLRAKTASDSDTLREAQELLGHTSESVTRRVYRRGEKVRPLR